MQNIIEEIEKLKKNKNAVILAHNYQLPEVQDIADYVGDSLGLSQQAAETDAEIIVFCGVHFMAETASIISPNKKVLLPDLDAGCSLASSISIEQLIEWKSKNPNAVVVSYVNTTAEIKAETDYCCTSSNAAKIVEAIPDDREILFLPDQFLGKYIETITGRKMQIWEGSCHVHEKIDESSFVEKREKYSDAEYLIHPECGCSTSCLLKATKMNEKNVHIFSTEGMVNFVTETDSDKLVIATEVGIIHRLKKLANDKEFIPAHENAICEYMKMITLEKVLNTLKNEIHEIRVPEDLAKRAKLSIDRMLAIH